MSNPRYPQGNLQRLKAGLQFNSFPGFNITPQFLAREGISLRFEGDLTSYYATMTGAVTSQENFIMVTAMIHLVRTQAFANQWKQRIELDTRMGDIIIRPDSTQMDPWSIRNAAIITNDPMALNGSEPTYTIAIRGTYDINSILWT